MQRGLAGFVRAVALEALNLGATVAAGAEVALAGESSASHTAGIKQALRQASGLLMSSADMACTRSCCCWAAMGEQRPTHDTLARPDLGAVQASAQLRSASGPRTAASSAATAVRTALLGVRNTLDKEHALERRLNS